MKAFKFFLCVIVSALILAATICFLSVIFPSEARVVPANAEINALTSAEENLVIRVICAETGEAAPISAKVAVASVILNRIENPGFPSNAVDVIFAANAFYSVSCGSINRDMNEEELGEAERALHLAMSGRDPTNGALYFAYKNSTAAKGIEVTFTAGNFIFGTEKENAAFEKKETVAF